MAPQILSPQTIAETQQMLRWWRQNERHQTGAVQPGIEPHSRHVRWAKTVLTAADPTYTYGKILPCVLGEYTFVDSAVGDGAATFTAYEPQDPDQIRYAYFRWGWRPLGSIIRLTLHNGKWFANDEGSEIYGKIDESGGIAAAGSGDFDVWWAGALTSPLQTITVHFDKMAVGTAAEDKMALVRFFPDEDHFSIVELEC